MRVQKILSFMLWSGLMIASCVPNSKILNNTNAELMSTPTEPQGEIPVTHIALAADIDRFPPDSFPNPDLTSLVDGNNKFAFSLYRAINKVSNTKNLVFSPYSITLALAMTYGGAGDETANEMRQALQVELPEDRFHKSWNNLDQWLANLEKDSNKNDEGFDLQISNAVWVQQGYPFLESYLNLLAEYYGAGLQTTDFVQFPEESRLSINNLVADQTHQKIKNLIPPGAIHPLTRMALVNAIYLSAPWRQPFDEKLTSEKPFYLIDGSKIAAPFMEQTQEIPYYVDDFVKMVSLPYSDGQLSMVVMMPASGSFQQFSNQLDFQEILEMVENQSNGNVEINIPRFRLENGFNLNEMLKNLGMNQAFIPDQADFSGMEPGREIYIDQVFHKAFIDVNEAGTEAAAATAVLMAGKGFNPDEPQKITFDHPFLFFIQEKESGTILFIGQVTTPNG